MQYSIRDLYYKLSLQLVTLVGLVSLASLGHVNVVGSAGVTWPITKAEPKSVELTRFGGPVASRDAPIQIYQYSELKRNVALTTGASLSFVVGPSMTVSSVFSGSGPKIELPASLSLKEDHLTDSVHHFADVKEGTSVTLIVASASPAYGKAHAAFDYPGTPSPAQIKKVSKLPAADPETIKTSRSGLLNIGDKHCGFETFRERSAYATRNPLALAKLPKLFQVSNLFARFNDRRDITQLTSCSPASSDGRVRCKAGGMLRGWAPFTVYFNGRHLCETDRMIELARQWLESKIVAETIPATSQP